MLLSSFHSFHDGFKYRYALLKSKQFENKNTTMFKKLLFEKNMTYMQAATLAMGAYLMLTLSDTMAKWLMDEGYDRAQVLVINTIPSTLCVLAYLIKKRGIRQCLHTDYKKLHLFRAIAVVSITFFSFMALKALPLADFYGVMFSSPLAVTIAATLFFKEKTDPTEWIVIAVGFIGVLIIVNPDFSSFNYGYLWAFMGVLSIVCSGLTARKIGKHESPLMFIVFGNIGVILANFIPAVLDNLPPVRVDHLIIFVIYSTTILLAIGGLSTLYARAPSVTAVAPYQYSQILWGGVIGYLIFGDIPQFHTIIGTIIVIACGLYILFHHRRKNRRLLQEAATPTSNV